jgi:hypothetical protein
MFNKNKKKLNKMFLDKIIILKIWENPLCARFNVENEINKILRREVISS